MATPLEDIQQYERGAARIRAAAPSFAARPVAQAAAPAAARPSAPAGVAPTPAGTRFGNTVRNVIGTAGGLAGSYVGGQARAVGTLGAAATAVPRATGGLVRDAGRALMGAAPSPDAGRPLSFASVRPIPTARAAPAGLASKGAARPNNWSQGPASRPVPRLAPAAAGPSRLPAPPAADSNFNLQPGDANTFTGSDGITKPVPGMLQQPGSPAAAPQTPIVAARPVATGAAPRGRQGAIIANPSDSTADKLQRAMMSASLKGSPSARAAVAQAILGDAAAVRDERASALRAGDEADLATIDNNARAADANADRDLQAQQFNATLAERRVDRQEERLARRPEVTVAEDGAMGIVSNDGRFQSVTDADGRTVRAPMAPKQTGELTDADRLKSYTDRYNAIAGDLTADPATKQQRLAELDADPLYAGLRPASRAQQPPAEAVAQLRANPGAAADFDEIFGAGAAQRYLGN